jgi:hypothetical protein
MKNGKKGMLREDVEESSYGLLQGAIPAFKTRD